MTGRIDTHTHVVPPEYRTWLEQHSAYRGPFVDWSEDATVEYFERLGVATAILSVSTPDARISPADERDDTRRIARVVNEFSAELVRNDPARFGFFATLALPDVEGAIAEAQSTLDELAADGVVLMTNAEGTYVGAPQWDPLLEFLDSRAAVVYLPASALLLRHCADVRPLRPSGVARLRAGHPRHLRNGLALRRHRGRRSLHRPARLLRLDAATDPGDQPR